MDLSLFVMLSAQREPLMRAEVRHAVYSANNWCSTFTANLIWRHCVSRSQVLVVHPVHLLDAAVLHVLRHDERGNKFKRSAGVHHGQQCLQCLVHFCW